jgi:hypothetical protein
MPPPRLGETRHVPVSMRHGPTASDPPCRRNFQPAASPREGSPTQWATPRTVSSACTNGTFRGFEYSV